MRPENLKYRPSHEWLRVDGEFAWIGISDFAVSHLSDLVFLDLPDIGTDLMANEPFGEIESVKAVSDLYSPITAEVIEQNEALLGDLSILSKSPFDEGWMIKVRIQKPEEVDQLLDATSYEEIVKAEKDNA